MNASIRLVRGTAGSGKTLVLTRRAIYLAAQNPEWRICVLTFNDKLARLLEANLRGYGNVKVSTFSKLCSALLRDYRPYSGLDNPRAGCAPMPRCLLSMLA